MNVNEPWGITSNINSVILLPLRKIKRHVLSQRNACFVITELLITSLSVRDQFGISLEIMFFLFKMFT